MPTAELFVSIFHSIEAGIADAISSFKWMKNSIICEKKHLPNWIILLTEHLSHDIMLVVFYLAWNMLENVYNYRPTVLAAHGLRYTYQQTVKYVTLKWVGHTTPSLKGGGRYIYTYIYIYIHK